MVVLALFDGMSCGREAIRQLGVRDENVLYYASEIDKHAIEVAQDQFPITIQLGDVRRVKYIPNLQSPSQSVLIGADGTQHVVGVIHIVLGGSPCQGVSSEGNIELMQHPQTVLFQEYTRLLGACHIKTKDMLHKPKFLLENVRNAKFEVFVTDQLERYSTRNDTHDRGKPALAGVAW